MTARFDFNWHLDAHRTISGLKLRYATWTSTPKESITRWVVLINGRTEFVEKYEYLPRDLALPSDVGFLTWDHRGQGASDGNPLHVEDFHDYVKDAREIIDFVVGEKPYDIISHSMGGLITTLGVCTNLLHPEHLILLSPYLGLSEKIAPPLVARFLAKSLSVLGFSNRRWPLRRESSKPFLQNRLTTDLARFERLKTFDYPESGPTIRWIQASIEAMDLIHRPEHLMRVTMPLTMLIGSLDSIVSYDGAHQWVKLVRETGQNKNVFVKDFGDAKHELLTERAEVYQGTLELIRKALSENSK